MMTLQKANFERIYLLSCRLRFDVMLISILLTISLLTKSLASMSTSKVGSSLLKQTPQSSSFAIGKVLLLDHVNFNHGKGIDGKGDKLLQDYFVDTLGFSYDPRKDGSGTGTRWVNAGITQFHMPSAPEAQVINGVISVAYTSVEALNVIQEKLEGKAYMADRVSQEQLRTRCPWGNQFKLIADASAFDPRGLQPGVPRATWASARDGESVRPLNVCDVNLYVERTVPLAGVGRFYEHVLGCPVAVSEDGTRLAVVMSPQQTLTFSHDSYEPGLPHVLLVDSASGVANHGIHLSMYVSDFGGIHRRASALGSVFINHRFGRGSYKLDEARRDGLFRLLDIIDPADQSPLLQLEHEVRAVVGTGGAMLPSAPFHGVPADCIP